MKLTYPRTLTSLLLSGLFSINSANAAETVAAEPSEPQKTKPQKPTRIDAGWEKQRWIKRVAPRRNMVEIGVYGGLFFPAENHDFYHPDSAPQDVLWLTGPDIGLRVGYYPLNFLGLELEGAVMPTRVRNLSNDSVLLYAARGHAILQLPFWRVTPFLLGGYGLIGVSSPNEVFGRDIDPVGHYGLGFKIFFTRWLALRFDVRHLLGAFTAKQDSFSHHFQTNLGVSFAFGGKRPAPVNPDRDGDGILNKVDQCPDTAGVAPHGCPDGDGDGFQDSKDRCPQDPGIAPDGCPDRDGDSFIDPDDKCPDEPGVAPDGCPKDSDGDGFADPQDKCPEVPGIAPDGCPGDSDGDGFLDPEDKCPQEPENRNNFEDDDGCPDEIPKSLAEIVGVIDGITFDFNSAKIRPQSKPILNKAVEKLKQYPEVRVRISGHTDDVGEREYNIELSRQRAEAVREYLIEKGLSADRISTRGVGPDEPKVLNDSEVNRAINRRIEFDVLSK